MTPYERWQLEKFGNVIPDEEPKDDEDDEPLWPNMEGNEPCEWLENEEDDI